MAIATAYKYDPQRDQNTFVFNDHALTTIDVAHARLHDGNMFRAGYMWASIADDATATVLIATSASAAHLDLQATFGGDFFGVIYEGAAVTGASGTAMTAFCMNRATPLVATTKFFHGPEGVSATGTAISPMQYFPGGGGPLAPGGGGRTEAEWILSGNQQYLIRIINKAGGAKIASLVAEWYEDDD